MSGSFQNITSRLRQLWHVWVVTFGLTAGGVAVSHVYLYFSMGPEFYMLGISMATVLPVAVLVPLGFFWSITLLRLNRMQEKLTSLLSEDHLTKVMTRERFMSASQRFREMPGVVLMVDIDHFKSINDNYGHAAGDTVLMATADRMRGTIRPSDVLARLGGEEFAVFLPNADLASGYVVAERLRKAVAAHPFAAEGRHVGVTVSVGFTFKPEGTEVELGLKAADRALYEAKNNGRNQSVQSAIGAGDRSREIASSTSLKAG